MIRIFITGSAGFIGFHLARALLEQGHHVAGFDGLTSYYDVRLKEARLGLLSEFPHYTHTTGMLEDRSRLERSIDDARPEVILHLAAQAGVRYSIEAPRSYVDSNLVGTANVLEAARHVRPQHLLLASTSSVYGANEKVPFCEADRTDTPVSLYAATKKSCEAMAHAYAHLFDVPTTCLRFFTVYGPWGRPDMALFKFVSAIRDGRQIEVYGQGQMARDFTYIADLVASVGRLIEKVPETAASDIGGGYLSAAPYRTVNIATGKPVALMDFIAVIERCLDRKAQLAYLDMQAGDVQRTWGDTRLLDSLVGPVPKTAISDGVAAFVEWHRAHYNPLS